MQALYSLWTAAGRLCRALTRLMDTASTAVEQATADAEARLELPKLPAPPAPAAESGPPAARRLPPPSDPDDPDARVPTTHRNGRRQKVTK